MKKYRTKPVIQHGVVMNDPVAVPPRLLARVTVLKRYLGISRAYAERLGPKAGPKRTEPKRR